MEALGKNLRLDVGKPREKALAADGKTVIEVRDDFGLRLDPKIYAKPSCSGCSGEGVIQLTRPVDAKTMAALVKTNPANKALVNEKTRKKDGETVACGNWTKRIVTCGCVPRHYQKTREKVKAAVDKALAEAR